MAPPEATIDNDDRQEPSSALKERLESLRVTLRRPVDWIMRNRLKAGLLAGACLVSMGGVVVLCISLAAAGSVDPAAILEEAFQALDSGNFDGARKAAQSLKKIEDPSFETLAGAAYLLGAAAACEADQTWHVDTESLYLLAARHLDEARDRGFPSGREAEGQLLLGKSLYLGGQIPQSRPILKQALESNPQEKTAICRLLADAYLNDSNPDYEKALQYNTFYLDERVLPPAVRNQGLLQRARILLHLGDISECTNTLSQIPDDAGNRADATVLAGQVLMHEARELTSPAETTPDREVKALEKYQAAVKTFRTAQSRDTLASQAGVKAMYLIGVCFRESGDSRAALAQFIRTTRTSPDTPEALASHLQIAEIARLADRDADALAAYRLVLTTASKADGFRNPWITLDDLRSRSLEAYRYYFQAEKYVICLQLTWLFYPTFSRVQTIELMAQTRDSWGKSLLAAAEHLPPAEAETLAQQGREHLRTAGRNYQRLAEARVTSRAYPDDLWAAAEDYMLGHSFTAAIEVLREYLRNESRRRHPRALVNLGEALLALGKTDETLDAFRQCVEFHPNDAASYRARLAASHAHLEKGETDKARELLRENLDGDFLTPASEERRDSLFAMGRLLHTEGDYDEAVIQLEEAVARYPNSAKSTEAAYLIGDCCLRRAREAEERLESDRIQSVKTDRLVEIEQLLNRALGHFEEVKQSLGIRQENTELTSLEQSLLRNCCFAVGGVLLDLGHFEEAVKAYTEIINRYQNAPEVLEAYVQIARAYRHLNRPDGARGALKQAEIVLARLQTTDQLAVTTIYHQQEWSDVLGWLNTL